MTPRRGPRIDATQQIADCILRPFTLRQVSGLQEIVQPDHAVWCQKLRQQPFRILSAPCTSNRANDHRDVDRQVLLLLSITIFPLYVSMDASGVNRAAKSTWIRDATGVELMNKIE